MQELFKKFLIFFVKKNVYYRNSAGLDFYFEAFPRFDLSVIGMMELSARLTHKARGEYREVGDGFRIDDSSLPSFVQQKISVIE